MIPVFDYMQKPFIEVCADTLLSPCHYLFGGRMVSCVRLISQEGIDHEMYAKPIRFERRRWKTLLAIVAFTPSVFMGSVCKIAALCNPCCLANCITYYKKPVKPALKLLPGQTHVAVYATRTLYLPPILERIRNRYEDGVEIKVYTDDTQSKNAQLYFVRRLTQSGLNFFGGDGDFARQNDQDMQHARMVMAGSLSSFPVAAIRLKMETQKLLPVETMLQFPVREFFSELRQGGIFAV